MNLDSRGEETFEGEYRSKQSKDRVPTFYYVLINILLLFIRSGNNKTQMLIVFHNHNSLAIESPWLGILIKGHVQLGSSYNHLRFTGIEPELVLLGVVAHDI